ncbi:hypothetical protein [Solimonas terrae]|uniref:Acetyltransferase n=1 Tax=Solimonas terrae TaxID=1396819 RepID=A0A6M2BX59_9GAMM|nr:hypothetical protein [Solimonas terrae]NGY06964.1 hypothetical protein [Solimonas terrae]
MILVFGAGGVALEIAWLLDEMNPRDGSERVAAFVVSDSDWRPGEVIDGIPVTAEGQLQDLCGKQLVDVYIGIGDSAAKRRALTAAEKLPNRRYPPLIHPSVVMDRRPGKVTFGHGAIVYPGASLSTEVAIGNFVHINPRVAIAHHSRVGDFSTVCPGGIISGRVSLGSDCFVGAGAVVKDSLSIIDGCTIGAGATVIRSILAPGVYIGTPARPKT